jgi:membrane protein
VTPLRDIGRDFVDQFMADDAFGLAAELAYRFLFALFPFGIFLAALAAFIASSLGTDPSGAIIRGLGDNLPGDVASSIRPELSRILDNTRPGLLAAGAAGSLWAATSGTLALIKAMNRTYDVRETRPTFVRYAKALGLTVLAGAGIIASFVTLVGGALLPDVLVRWAGLPEGIARTLTLLRWPVVFALLVAAVAILVRVAPNVRPPWRLALAAGALFAVAWILATWLFGVYVQSFGTYDATYGTLAGFAVVMAWFYLTALVLVAAAEVTAVLTKRFAPELLSERREATRAELEVSHAAREVKEVARGAVANAAETLGQATGRDDRAGIDRGPRPRGTEAEDDGAASDVA